MRPLKFTLCLVLMAILFPIGAVLAFFEDIYWRIKKIGETPDERIDRERAEWKAGIYP